MEIWEKIDKKSLLLSSTLEDLRSSNDVQKYIDNAKEAANLLDDLFSLFNNNKEALADFYDIKQLVLNFENIVYIYFMDSDSVANFRRLTIPQKEMNLIAEFFLLQKGTSQMLDFTIKYRDLMEKQNAFPKIFFVIKYYFSLKTIDISYGEKEQSKEKCEEQSKVKYIEILREALTEVRSSSASNEGKGELLLIILYVFWGFLPPDECLLKFDSESYKLFRIYMNYLKPENDNFSNFERLFESIILYEMRNDKYGGIDLESIIKHPSKIKGRVVLSHYTTIESLYYILESNQIKFTRLDSLNDLNENKSLYNGDDQVFTFSLTSEPDDLSLFGNYTQYNGLSIQFDLGNISEAFSGVAYSNGENFGYTFADISNIFYDSDVKGKFDEAVLRVRKIYKKYITPPHLDHAMSRLMIYVNYFCKDNPWKYEKEWRIAIPYKNDMDNAEFRSGKFTDQAIYLNFNPKSLIKGIVLGPAISKSAFQKRQVDKILKEFNMSKIQVLETDSNFRIK